MRKALLILWLSLALLLSGCGKEEEKAVVVRKNQPEKIEGKAIEDREELKKLIEPVQRDLQKEPPKESPPDLKGMPSEPIDVKSKEFVQSSKFLAEPLPNGVIFDDNLSVSIAAIWREPKITRIWLAFRCLNNSDWGERFLRLVIYDDRGNVYASSSEINMASFADMRLNENWPRIPKRLPNGFTWFSCPIEIEMPEIAPIVNIKIKRQIAYGAGYKEEESNIDFRNPSFPALDFELKPEEVISPGKEIKIDEHLSMRLEQINSEREVRSGVVCIKYIIPFTIKNSDYNPRSSTLAGYFFYTLYNNGRFSGGNPFKVYTDGTWSEALFLELSPKLPVPALGIQTYTYYVWVKIIEQEKTSVRMFLMCYEGGGGSYCFRYLIPISLDK